MDSFLQTKNRMPAITSVKIQQYHSQGQATNTHVTRLLNREKVIPKPIHTMDFHYTLFVWLRLHNNKYLL
jgi:hypothetical protein